jgi:hypothetical protein
MMMDRLGDSEDGQFVTAELVRAFVVLHAQYMTCMTCIHMSHIRMPYKTFSASGAIAFHEGWLVQQH